IVALVKLGCEVVPEAPQPDHRPLKSAALGVEARSRLPDLQGRQTCREAVRSAEEYALQRAQLAIVASETHTAFIRVAIATQIQPGDYRGAQTFKLALDRRPPRAITVLVYGHVAPPTARRDPPTARARREYAMFADLAMTALGRPGHNRLRWTSDF